MNIRIKYRSEDFFDGISGDVNEINQGATLDAYDAELTRRVAEYFGEDTDIEISRNGGTYTRVWIDGEEIESVNYHPIGNILDDTFASESIWIAS